ncbi:hypothetical protein [Virgibacillus proomii]|uniref:hypothetical protein n=1 Tax=Virgibacillus proomii TaxID=84407 RepID=UPI000987CAFE|nr:hypothetical protein [Virgibacillus proomii]
MNSNQPVVKELKTEQEWLEAFPIMNQLECTLVLKLGTEEAVHKITLKKLSTYNKRYCEERRWREIYPL